MKRLLPKGLGCLFRGCGQSGQIEVETAIVMPMMVFLVLGLIQMGLIHQASLFAKYSAFKAVRAGALKNGDVWEMEIAGLAAALPVLAYRPAGGNMDVLGDYVSGDYRTAWLSKWSLPQFGGTAVGDGNVMSEVPTNYQSLDGDETRNSIPYVYVRICGPTRAEAGVFGYGGGDLLPFDTGPAADFVNTTTTKLRITLTLNYRMFIPFANWIIYRMWRLQRTAPFLRVGRETTARGNADPLDVAANAGYYILPIRIDYATKMHSDIPVNRLPAAVPSECR